MAQSGLLDVHHHFIPDAYREALDRTGNPPDGIARVPDWSEDEAIRFLDATGIETAYLSISSPGVLLEGSDATDLARRVNDIAAELIGRQAGRFGAFAALPLPDVGDSLAELARALDELKLDGIGLMTHHGDVYLGDPRLDEVFDELNRRAATVFIHPTTPLCCGDAFLDYPRPALEFIFDTARAVMNLIHSGTLDRCPDVNWIIPHGGGALPALSLRLDAVHTLAPGRSPRSAAIRRVSRPVPLRPRRPATRQRAAGTPRDHGRVPTALRQRLAVHPRAGRRSHAVGPSGDDGVRTARRRAAQRERAAAATSVGPVGPGFTAPASRGPLASMPRAQPARRSTRRTSSTRAVAAGLA